MGAEARVDEGVLHCFGIEHRRLTAGTLERESLGGWVFGSFLAEVRIVDAAHRRRQPQPALLVEHRIVIVRSAIPDLLLAPIGRRRQRLHRRRGMQWRSKHFRHCRILHRQLEVRNLVRLRVEDRNIVSRVFRRAKQRTVSVDGRITAIRGNQIVEILVGDGPFPRRDDDIALFSFRPRRLVLRCSPLAMRSVQSPKYL